MERNTRTVDWVVFRLMWQEIAFELLKGIGKLFINPLFYVAILFAIVLGYVRVKRERRFFRTRILWGWTETKRMVQDTWLYALMLSIVSVGVGLTLTTDWIVTFSLVSVVLIVLFIFQLGSPILAASLAVAALWVGSKWGASFTIWTYEWSGAENWLELALPVALLIGVAVIVEGLLIRNTAAEYSSPVLEKSSRGLTAAGYLSKRLWMLPVLVVVPGNVIPDFLPFWPQFTLGNDSFGLVLFPIVIAFQQKARHTLPVYFYPRVGNAVITVGITMLVIAISAIWMPIFAAISLAVGSLVRIGVWVYFAYREKQGSYAVTPQDSGVMIAGVLPDSPAEKMGLTVGECIRKVNGQTVTNERELYEAIQINAAHCRLEVLDHHGEVRLRQHVIYHHDHHRLGLLVVR